MFLQEDLHLNAVCSCRQTDSVSKIATARKDDSLPVGEASLVPSERPGQQSPVSVRTSSNYAENTNLLSSHKRPLQNGLRHWQLLKKAVCDSARIRDDQEKRCFVFQLFSLANNAASSVDGLKVSQLTHESSGIGFSDVWLGQEEEAVIDLKTLTGFDNTGNIRIWPAEEVMAHWLVENQDALRGRRVLELAGGNTCLAGQVLAHLGVAEQVILSDGNARCVEVLQKGVKRLCRKEVCSKLIDWNRPETFEELRCRVEAVIMADCLLDINNHENILRLLRFILKNEGCVYVFAPERDQTLSHFITQAKKLNCFIIHVSYRYNKKLVDFHEKASKNDETYNATTKFPILVTLTLKICERCWSS